MSSPAKVFSTKPHSASRLGFTDSDLSSAECPGPGASTPSLTISPPSRSAIFFSGGRGVGMVAPSLANSVARGLIKRRHTNHVDLAGAHVWNAHVCPDFLSDWEWLVTWRALATRGA